MCRYKGNSDIKWVYPHDGKISLMKSSYPIIIDICIHTAYLIITAYLTKTV